MAKLQGAAMRDRQEAETRRRTRPLQREPEQQTRAADGPSGVAATTSRPTGVPDACRAVYDRAHAALRNAHCLVLDTETSGFTGSVLNIGWILADTSGCVLMEYECLWLLGG